MSASFFKDPSATLDYAWDWTGWLAASETITSTTVTAPAGLTVGTVTTNGGVITAWLSAGVDGTSYRVTCRIVTNQGRIDERDMTVRITNR